VTLELHIPAAALTARDNLTGFNASQPDWALRAEEMRRALNPSADQALMRALGLVEDPALRS